MTINHFDLGIISGLASLFLSFLYQSFFTVEEGHVGIITYFGKAELDSEEKLKLYFSGAHLKWPWGNIYRISTMEQVFDLHDDDGKSALAYDGTVLRLEAKLRYQANIENIYDYFFTLKNPIDHIKGLFTSLLSYQIASFKGDEKNAVVSSYASIRKERKILNDQLDRFCHENLQGRYGIELQSIDLIDILPPEELDQALNAVLSADVEAEAMYYRAEASCIQKKLAAKAGVEIEKSKAEAAEIEILTLGNYLLGLDEDKTLNLYIERRKKEVLYDTKNIFIRG
ncbi:MAG: SPFH domain-containing protein [Bacteriovorax sp.]|nr:SPFH domain-containing protein [Bacteriovorax sp.]